MSDQLQATSEMFDKDVGSFISLSRARPRLGHVVDVSDRCFGHLSLEAMFTVWARGSCRSNGLVPCLLVRYHSKARVDVRADIRARNLEASLSFQSSSATEEAQGKRVASRLIWMREMICGGGGVGNGHFNRVY